ncbi:MAG: T9SS type A sorting domain-containing protein, partial [Sphingobacteriia bacterium]|nr:T9SS type A sorting domain-containing protein [Sphingobacteriia bacterium]
MEKTNINLIPMKSHINLILLLLVFEIAGLNAQTYFDIEFAGANDVVPQTILITNLTKGTNVIIQGTDILRLNVITSVRQVEIEKNNLRIYPSPMEQNCYVEFLNAQEGRVDIQILTIDGKMIYQSTKQLSQGKHKFLISGVLAGMYVLSMKTTSGHITGHFVSKGKSGSVLDIIPIVDIYAYEISQKTVEATSLKQNIQDENNSSVVNMDYIIGDNLSFLGSATGYVNQTIYASPTGSQLFTFFL